MVVVVMGGIGKYDQPLPPSTTPPSAPLAQSTAAAVNSNHYFFRQ
jgi:hypothetical protein